MTNKRFIGTFIIMFLLFLVVFGTAGCTGGDDSSNSTDNEPNNSIPRPEQDTIPAPNPDPTPAPVSYTVTFNSNGGSSLQSITVPSGNTVTKPANPSKYGCTFGGWTRTVR